MTSFDRSPSDARRAISRRVILKFTGAGAALAAASLLQACGSTASTSTPVPLATAAPAAPAKPTTAPTTAPKATQAAVMTTTPQAAAQPTGEQITLNIAAVKVAQTVWVDSFQKIWGDYQKQNPNVKLQIEEDPFGGFDVKMLTAVAGGAIFDLIYGWGQWLPTWSERDVIQPLDSFMKQDKSFDITNYHQDYFETWKGKTYGIPWFVSLLYMYYNKSALHDAGADDPQDLEKQGKWTWENARAVAAKASKGTGVNRVYGIQNLIDSGSGVILAIAAPWAWGTDLYSSDMTKSLFADQKWIDAVQFQMDMIYTDHSEPLPSETKQEGGPSFLNGKMLMVFQYPSFNRTVVEGKPQFTVAEVPLPKGPGGRSAPILDNSWYFGAHTKYPDQVWKLNSYLIGPHGQELVVPLGERYPVDKRIKPTTEYPFESVDVINFTSTIGKPIPLIKPEAKFETAFTTAMDAIVLKQKTVQQGLTDLARQADDLLKG